MDNGISKDDVKRLIAKRDQLDKELASLHDVLRTLNSDMDSPLVDVQGFPRAELDIPVIRQTRKTINCLTNDRHQLTAQIDQALQSLHQCTSSSGSSENNEERVVPHRPTNKTFLLIENVVYGSPAFEGGLAPGDEVVQFEHIHALNFENLKQISDLITTKVGGEVHITVLRKVKVHRLVVRLLPWDGVGVFGARLTSVDPKRDH